MNHLINNYTRLPVAFSHGEGYWLYDTEGKQYLDALSGIAVSALGHAHPALVAALSDQAGKLLHCSNLYDIPEQTELARKLCELSGMASALFCNSGAEANEAAIKLARLHGHARNIDTPKIVVMEQSFHGRTLAALAATGNPAAQKGFEPLPEGFIRVPFGDADAIRELDDSSIAAVLVEPIQGEGGVRIPNAGYLKAIRDLCTERNWLMMLDEVQTGIGRTGKWFAFQHESITPDVMALAKGLGGGMPIGACLVNGPASSLFGPGSHGTTFGGNPLACRAGLAVIDTLQKAGGMDRISNTGEQLLNQLRDNLKNVQGIVDIRGQGLIVAIELEQPCTELVPKALEQGMLINVTAGKVIRLLPPLIIDQSGIDQLAERLTTLVQAFQTTQCSQ